MFQPTMKNILNIKPFFIEISFKSAKDNNNGIGAHFGTHGQPLISII